MPKNKKKRKAHLMDRRKELIKKNKQYQEEQRKFKNKEFAHDQRVKKYKRSIARVPYRYDDNILLIGEGNFSFALGLVKYFQKLQLKYGKNKNNNNNNNNNTGSNSMNRSGDDDDEVAKKMTYNYSNIFATSYDSEEEVYTKYPEAKDIVKELNTNNVNVLHSIDATNLINMKDLLNIVNESKKQKGGDDDDEEEGEDYNSYHDDGGDNSSIKKTKKSNDYNFFNHIVFNFPHTGCGIKDTLQNNRHHQRFLTDFFKSSIPLLAKSSYEEDNNNMKNNKKLIENGQIHITLKKGEPYDSWAVPRVARLAVHGLKLRTQQDFYPELYKGYEHRRTVGGLNLDGDDIINNNTNTNGNVDINNKKKKQKKNHDDLKNKDISKIGSRTYIFQVIDENQERMKQKRRMRMMNNGGNNKKRKKGKGSGSSGKKQDKFLK